jgi:hypothetical protein
LRVGGQRERRGQRLHEQPADARSADEGQRPAPVHQRIALDIAIGGHQRDEQHRVRDGEQHAQRPGRESNRIQLHEGQHPQRVADRDAGQQRGATEISSFGQSWAPGEEGLLRDSAMYSVIASEWPSCEDHLLERLGTALKA